MPDESRFSKTCQLTNLHKYDMIKDRAFDEKSKAFLHNKSKTTIAIL